MRELCANTHMEPTIAAQQQGVRLWADGRPLSLILEVQYWGAIGFSYSGPYSGKHIIRPAEAATTSG